GDEHARPLRSLRRAELELGRVAPGPGAKVLLRELLRRGLVDVAGEDQRRVLRDEELLVVLPDARAVDLRDLRREGPEDVVRVARREQLVEDEPRGGEIPVRARGVLDLLDRARL